ncbi:class I adenylate-forming enzyme family protein [Streptomyces sp. NPDC046876]|uniref:class I adenylate-forming enzyme family protein n=1 Tax=Streptomyces sp. NPDC046876 TaxID=3155616 RepID=UPI003409D533
MSTLPAELLGELPKLTAPLGVLPELAAERHGNTPFLSDTPWASYGREVSTVAEFAVAVFDYADRFWAAGIRRDETVVVIQRNHVELQAVLCGLGRIGAVPVLLSPGMDVGDLLESLAKLGRPTVVLDRAGLARIGRAQGALRALAAKVVALDEADEPWLVPTVERAAHQANPRAAEDWVVVTHSSGTTGVPKLAAHSSLSLFGQVAPQISVCRLYGTDGIAAKHLSNFHVRTCSGVLAFLEVAMPSLSISDPRPHKVKPLLLEHRPTSLETHPNVYIHWERLAADPDRPLSSVSRFISTFDAIHPRTVRALLAGSDRPDVHYLQGYGQTESGPISLHIVTPQTAADYHVRNVGFPGGDTEVRIVDEDGNPVETGVSGHIETRSPGRMRGYIGAGPMIAEDDWWPMGDVGRQLADGSIELLDRIFDQNADTVSLLEQEDQLLDEFPELNEAVLVKTDPGDRVVAVVSPREGREFDIDAFRQAAKRIGLEDLPVHVWPWEALPLTATYKVRRAELRARLANDLARIVPVEEEGAR